MSTWIKALTVMTIFGLIGCSPSASSSPSPVEQGGQGASVEPSLTSVGEPAETAPPATVATENQSSSTTTTPPPTTDELAEEESTLAEELETEAEHAINNGNYRQVLAEIERELIADERAIEAAAE